MADSHRYGPRFFQYINAGSFAAARVVCPLLMGWLAPRSVIDVGCGAGAWCRVWREQGVAEVRGVDGSYVDPASLLIPPEDFRAIELSRPFDEERRFDLVTSLEVAEHLPADCAETFIDNLVRHGSVVLFSAAVPGQGGEFHVNEQPLSYWRARFAQRGYRCFDPLRPRLRGDRRVAPWYRYNTLLYVASDAVSSLPEAIRGHEIPEGQPIPEVASRYWLLRNAMLRALPARAHDVLVFMRHEWGRRVRPFRA